MPPTTSQPVCNRDVSEIPCPQCDYNLFGCVGDRCPGCGWEIDADRVAAELGRKSSGSRIGLALTALIVGLATLVALASLVIGSRVLSVADGLVVVGVLVAVAGYLSLSYLAAWHGSPWPMRRGTASDLLQFAGWVSMMLGVASASHFVFLAPRTRFVRGVQVHGAMEFLITAALFCLPGALLLSLRMVAFRERAPSAISRKRNGDYGRSSLPVGASFSIDFAACFGRGLVLTTWSQTTRPSTPAIQALIAQTWEAELASATLSGSELYNGELIGLDAAHPGCDSLVLDCSPTCYRDFVGTNLVNARKVIREMPEALSHALGVSAAVLTQDGAVALGRRSRRVGFHAGYLHPFGGMVEATDRRDDKVDVFGAIARELAEELNLSSQEIADIKLTGLVRDRAILQPELLFDVSLTLTKRELLQRFERHSGDHEHTAVEWAQDEPDTIVPFLRRAAPVTPVAEAALLLHGRHAWGAEWYEQTCLVLFGELPPAYQPSPAV